MLHAQSIVRMSMHGFITKLFITKLFITLELTCDFESSDTCGWNTSLGSSAQWQLEQADYEQFQAGDRTTQTDAGHLLSVRFSDPMEMIARLETSVLHPLGWSCVRYEESHCHVVQNHRNIYLKFISRN